MSWGLSQITDRVKPSGGLRTKSGSAVSSQGDLALCCKAGTSQSARPRNSRSPHTLRMDSPVLLPLPFNFQSSVSVHWAKQSVSECPFRVLRGLCSPLFPPHLPSPPLPKHFHGIRSRFYTGEKTCDNCLLDSDLFCSIWLSSIHFLANDITLSYLMSEQHSIVRIWNTCSLSHSSMGGCWARVLNLDTASKAGINVDLQVFP